MSGVVVRAEVLAPELLSQVSPFGAAIAVEFVAPERSAGAPADEAPVETDGPDGEDQVPRARATELPSPRPRRLKRIRPRARSRGRPVRARCLAARGLRLEPRRPSPSRPWRSPVPKGPSRGLPRPPGEEQPAAAGAQVEDAAPAVAASARVVPATGFDVSFDLADVGVAANASVWERLRLVWLTDCHVSSDGLRVLCGGSHPLETTVDRSGRVVSARLEPSVLAAADADRRAELEAGGESVLDVAAEGRAVWRVRTRSDGPTRAPQRLRRLRLRCHRLVWALGVVGFR